MPAVILSSSLKAQTNGRSKAARCSHAERLAGAESAEVVAEDLLLVRRAQPASGIACGAASPRARSVALTDLVNSAA